MAEAPSLGRGRRHAQSLPAEKGNLVLVPGWNEEEDDEVLPVLVAALLEHVPASGDVRFGTAAVSATLAAAATKQKAARERAHNAVEAARCELKVTRNAVT